MQRILKNTSATLSRTFTVDGTGTDADGNVTVAIVDAAGTVVQAATNASSAGSGVYTYLLAPQTEVKELTATWTGTWSTVEQIVTDTVLIVGGHLFTETEARAFHDSALSNTTTYTDAAIAEARDRITDEFAKHCGVAFVPTYAYENREGTGGRVLYVDWPKVTSVISASIGGTAQTVADLKPMKTPSTGIYHTTGIWTAPSVSDPRNVVVEYVHGHTDVPLEIKRAALTVLRNQVVDSNIGDRTMSLTDEIGTIRLAQPGMYSAYGIPSVDAVLNRYSERIPVSASTLPTLLDNFRTQLMARGNLSGVTVTTVPVGAEDTSREHITFTRADQSESWDAMQVRGEQYTVEGQIIIQKPGAGNAAGKAAYDRAFALLEEVRGQLATDPTVNSAVLDCQVTEWAWRPSLTDPPGHVSVVDFTLTAQAHNV